jgi:hypothetical protein
MTKVTEVGVRSHRCRKRSDAGNIGRWSTTKDNSGRSEGGRETHRKTKFGRNRRTGIRRGSSGRGGRQGKSRSRRTNTTGGKSRSNRINQRRRIGKRRRRDKRRFLRNGCQGRKSKRTQSLTEKTTSLTGEDNKELEKGLRIGRGSHIANTSLEVGRSESEVRVLPGSERYTVANVGGSVRGREKQVKESVTSGTVRVQGKFIQVVVDGTKGNLDNDLLVRGSKLRRIIFLAEASDREETTVKGDGRRKERFHVEDRVRSRKTRERRIRRNRRHRSEQREREKWRNNLLLTSMRGVDEAWLNDERS